MDVNIDNYDVAELINMLELDKDETELNKITEATKTSMKNLEKDKNLGKILYFLSDAHEKICDNLKIDQIKALTQPVSI